VDEVTAVSPSRTFAGLEGEDTVFMLLRFRNGAVGTFANSIAAPGLLRWQWTWLTGTEGSLGIDHRGRFLWLRGRSGARRRLFLRDRRGLVAQLTEFVSAVRDGRPPEPAPEVGRADLELVLAAYRSIETGQPVSLGGKASADVRPR